VGTADILLLLAVSAAVATIVAAYIIIKRKAEEERQRREAEEERQAREKAEAERLAKQRAEEERIAWEKAEAQRIARETAEAERLAKQKAEEERLAQGKAEAGRIARETAEAERLAREKAEEERQAKTKPDHRPSQRPTNDHEKQPLRENKPRQPKPEIVCWQREWRWILAVEMPEELWGKPGLAVHQNASPLMQDEREDHWCLDKVCGQITVRWNEDETPQEATITLGEENCLLFKLSSPDHQKQGRRVKSRLYGSYLVVVPENWERDEQLSGSPPTSPQSVSMEGYLGHFFDLEKGDDKGIAFRTSEGEPIPIKSKATQFELIGTRLEDVSEGIGPLFGKSPPRIQASHGNVWADIGTVVIGEEGRGRGRWRKSFGPAQDGEKQELPAEAAPPKDGWYFLRFYDANDDLVESLDFRFVSALQEIKILRPSPFPSESGHDSVYVELGHEPGFVIQPADDLARNIQVESKNNKTALTVSPEPIYDETRWRVGSEGTPQVYITILVERLWWAVGQEGTLPLEWEDRLLSLTCDDFAPTSKKALWLRLPRRRWTDGVLVGFQQSRARPCPVKVTEKEISIPLRDIGDYQEMRGRDRDQFLSIWIKRDGELVEGIVAIIPASKRPPIICIEHGKMRKALATAVLRKGTGAITVNGRPIEGCFGRAPRRAKE